MAVRLLRETAGGYAGAQPRQVGPPAVGEYPVRQMEPGAPIRPAVGEAQIGRGSAETQPACEPVTETGR